jgi:hypothetical protein
MKRLSCRFFCCLDTSMLLLSCRFSQCLPNCLNRCFTPSCLLFSFPFFFFFFFRARRIGDILLTCDVCQRAFRTESSNKTSGVPLDDKTLEKEPHPTGPEMNEVVQRVEGISLLVRPLKPRDGMMHAYRRRMRISHRAQQRLRFTGCFYWSCPAAQSCCLSNSWGTHTTAGTIPCAKHAAQPLSINGQHQLGAFLYTTFPSHEYPTKQAYEGCLKEADMKE